MKRTINSSLLEKWIHENGGLKAENRIREKTGYSMATLYAMVKGYYRSAPRFAEREILLGLTGLNEADLFPPTGTNQAS